MGAPGGQGDADLLGPLASRPVVGVLTGSSRRPPGNSHSPPLGSAGSGARWITSTLPVSFALRTIPAALGAASGARVESS